MNLGNLLRRVGSLEQVFGCREFEFCSGPAKGVHAVEFYNFCGFRFTLLVDRAFDIYDAWYKDIPIAWLSPVGIIAPQFFEPEGYEWLRSFSGGLLTLCGLTQIGTPCEDGNEKLGLHGRISNVPGKIVRISYEESGQFIIFEGVVRQTKVFGENLQLFRRIEFPLGSPYIVIKDTVKNIGFNVTPLMILYHINLGYPLIDEGTLIDIRSQVSPRDEEAAKGLDKWHVMESPKKDFKEQVFYHRVEPNRDSLGQVVVRNAKLGLAFGLEFDVKALPFLIEWKMMGEGIYVLGVEPSTATVEGRVAARERGEIVYLSPGEEYKTYLRMFLFNT